MRYNAKASKLTAEAANRLAALLEELGLNKLTARERAQLFICRVRMKSKLRLVKSDDSEVYVKARMVALRL